MPRANAPARSSSALGGSSSVPSSMRRGKRLSAMDGLLVFLQAREAELLALCHVGFGHGARQGTDAQDVALALGHADRAARIEQIEGVAGLADLLVARQRQPCGDQLGGFALADVEPTEQFGHV